MTEWPEQLVRDLARRRCVVVLGSGISAQSISDDGLRPPTWKKFLNDALTRLPNGKEAHIRKAIDNGEYLHACEWIKRRMDEDWTEYLREIFLTPGFKPSSCHNAILQLDSRIVFSLNFDDIYERTANAAQPGSHIIKSYHDTDIPEFLRKDGRFIVKVHGSLNTPTKMIFTQEEYARSRTKNAAFYACFEASLLTHSFFFVGVGYNDPDLSLLLENQSFLFDGGQPHYYLTSSEINIDLITSLRKNRNLKTVKYDKVDSSYSGLSLALTELNELVEDARRKLLETTNW